MKASLDTNVIIHFYRANLQEILFEFFEEGLIIYEQIRMVELEHHAKELLNSIDTDIKNGKIELYTDAKLKEQAVYRLFQMQVKENRMLYGAGDLGEVYAISLAQTLGVYSLVTDDIKQGGPYMSLLQFEDEIMPFTFVDVLLLRYLFEGASAEQTIKDFETINTVSELNWSFQSQLVKFIRRFWKEPYRKEDTIWMQNMIVSRGIKVKRKFVELKELLREK